MGNTVHWVDFGDLGVLLFNVMNFGLEDCRTWIIFVLTFIYSIFRVYNEYHRYERYRKTKKDAPTKIK